MELVSEIKEVDIKVEISPDVEFETRKAARAVLFNKDNKIALLYVAKNKYHKLPGGGIEENEDVEQALRREVMEETGCTIDIKNPIGKTIEYKNAQKKLQTSYCYFANVVSDTQKFSFTEEEKSDGFALKWIELNEAINILEKDKPLDYMGKFIRARDLALLKKAKELLN